jgi:hypothetical protein
MLSPWADYLELSDIISDNDEPKIGPLCRHKRWRPHDSPKNSSSKRSKP